MTDISYLAASMRDDLPTIDLHGIRSIRTAEEQLERQLFLLATNNESACRVIHGIGSGRMKQMVHRILQKNPFVEEFLLSDDGGSTVVLL